MTPWSYKRARQLVAVVIGVTLLIIGVAMLVLPGPGLLVLYLGLAVLASEFVWARQWLARVKARIEPLTRQPVGWWQRLLARYQRSPQPPSGSR
jgi:uncharacterized protein (TIGR02611 family)